MAGVLITLQTRMTKYQKTYIKFLIFDLYLLTFLGLCVNAIFDYRFLARFIPLVMIVVFMVGMVVSAVNYLRSNT